MALKRLNIKDFLQASKHNLLLDVRSPAEFQHAHIPHSISFPLFTDEERKIVGTIYKQKSREEAIKTGLDFFAPKMRGMIEEVENMLKSKKHSEIYIYCWRGGMRSAAIAWLLDLYGFKVFSLAGGYKTFRNYVLQTFEYPYQLNIVGGYTGSGKTEVLSSLEKLGELVIDLERIACHKGSAFGGFKMPPQPTQEMFENLLATALVDKTMKYNQRSKDGSVTEETKSLFNVQLWLEDESQRIGDLNLPNSFWNTMRRASIIFLEIPFEERLHHIIEEYGECEIEKLIDSTRRISQRLGGLATKNTISFLEKGNIKEAFRILLTYYDKRYFKGLHNRENISTLLTKIHCETVTPQNALQLTKPQPV